jgi:hypothetical protein
MSSEDTTPDDGYLRIPLEFAASQSAPGDSFSERETTPLGAARAEDSFSERETRPKHLGVAMNAPEKDMEEATLVRPVLRAIPPAPPVGAWTHGSESLRLAANLSRELRHRLASAALVAVATAGAIGLGALAAWATDSSRAAAPPPASSTMHAAEPARDDLHRGQVADGE